jgi:hypothetical protein
MHDADDVLAYTLLLVCLAIALISGCGLIQGWDGFTTWLVLLVVSFFVTPYVTLAAFGRTWSIPVDMYGSAMIVELALYVIAFLVLPPLLTMFG